MQEDADPKGKGKPAGQESTVSARSLRWVLSDKVHGVAMGLDSEVSSDKGLQKLVDQEAINVRYWIIPSNR